MLLIRLASVFVFLASALGGAQPPGGSDDAVEVGPDVVAPRLVHKVEPEYSTEALIQGVMGTVVLSLIVDERGMPVNIAIVRPLGFGLDEKAREALALWRFKPGTRGGNPVKIWAHVDVSYRLLPTRSEFTATRRRTEFNAALATLRKTAAKKKDVDRALKSVRNLSGKGFAPAMYLLGVMLVEGDRVPPDAAAGLKLIQQAAEKDYGPAIYQLAIRRMEGRELARDSDWGLRDMARAAYYGSTQAQAYLAQRYESGDGLPQSREQAEHFYRYCAASGIGACQYGVARLLLAEPALDGRRRVEAVAWLQLAVENGVAEARGLEARELSRLSPTQIKSLVSLKPQLGRR